jgi:hypothetical protein
VSGIKVSFEPGGNVAGLLLNPSYNGGSDSALLMPGQHLVNQTSSNMDYFFKLRLSFSVSNLAARIYENSAIATATIGSMGTTSFINVSDSSNNGNESAVDPNNNGNAGEPGENNPTPFNFETLPVKFISISASIVNKTDALIAWDVAIPTVNSDKFEVEYSMNGNDWNSLSIIAVDNVNKSKYQYIHTHFPLGNLYYRIKEVDIDGAYSFSNIVLLRNENNTAVFTIYPNPANNLIRVNAPSNVHGNTKIVLFDASGRRLFSSDMNSAVKEINTAKVPDGTYIMKIENDGSISTQKIVIAHK